MSDPNRIIDPDTHGTRALRDALGRYATGVTVVTCASDAGPLGITANSFASVSLDPPLVLWSPAKDSARHDAFVATERFAVHVLGADQTALCNGFARNGAAFPESGWQIGAEAGDPPLIDGCLARFECARVAAHDGGDHTIIVARVLRATTRGGAPLLFFGGSYGRFDTL